MEPHAIDRSFKSTSDTHSRFARSLAKRSRAHPERISCVEIMVLADRIEIYDRFRREATREGATPEPTPHLYTGADLQWLTHLIDNLRGMGLHLRTNFVSFCG